MLVFVTLYSQLKLMVLKNISLSEELSTKSTFHLLLPTLGNPKEVKQKQQLMYHYSKTCNIIIITLDSHHVITIQFTTTRLVF